MDSVNISGGEKFETFFRKLKSKLSKGANLQVGFMGGSYDAEHGGMPIATIAIGNEFGGTVTIPAHDQTIYKSKNVRTGKWNKKGHFVKANKSNFQSTHHVDEYTVTRPPRPFFRRMISEGVNHWGADALKILKANNYQVEPFLEIFGEHLDNELRNSIQANVYAPLAKSTIRAKGHENQLVDSGLMLRSVSHRVDI